VVGGCGSAAAALDASAAEIVAHLPRPDPDTGGAVLRLQRSGWRRVARELEQAARRAGGTVIVATDAAYPELLARLEGRPPVLYVLGRTEVLAHPAVAAVGTRRPSADGPPPATHVRDAAATAGV